MKPAKHVPYTPPTDKSRPQWSSPAPFDIGDQAYPEIVPDTDTDFLDSPISKVEESPIRDKPVQVEIVNPVTPRKTLTRFNTQVFTIGPQAPAVRILSRRDNRIFARVVNTTDTKVGWIGESSDVTDTHDGFPLAYNKELDMRHQYETYVYNPDATTSIVIAVYTEYTTDVK